MKASRRTALVCAAVALVTSGVAVSAALSPHEGALSGLVRMSGQEPMASLVRPTDPGFSFVHPQAHYDGVYFYAIARDPLARGEAHKLIDRAAYRYGHAGYGWLAWLVSGGGRASAIPAALLIVGLIGVALAAYASSLLAQEIGWSGWGGLVIASSPGVIFAITADTSEPIALASVACGLLAWHRQRLIAAAAALMVACMVKEPLLLVPAGLLLWEVVRWIRGHRPTGFRARLLALSVGPTAFAAWYLYLRARFGMWPLEQEASDFLTIPFVGWADSLKKAAALSTRAFESSQIGSASVALLIVVGAGLLFGMVRAARLRTCLDTVFLLYALLIFSLNWLGILYPKDLVREAALPLALLPGVLADPRPKDLPVADSPGRDSGLAERT